MAFENLTREDLEDWAGPKVPGRGRSYRCNVEDLRIVSRTLRKKGWKVVRIWEHDLQDRVRLAKKTKRIKEIVQQSILSGKGYSNGK